jgi:1-deoxy-D-xylulose-5-phosphate synthase
VLELFNDQTVTTPVIRLGWPDQFIEHATTQDELRRKYGLSVENVVRRVKVQFGDVPAEAVKLIEVA